MTDSDIKILFIADIVGDEGFIVTEKYIGEYKAAHNIDLTIANGENAASGKGMTRRIAQNCYDIGIDVITSGNHIWDKHKFYQTLEEDERVLRPMNYPPGCPGRGSYIATTKNNIQIGVINLQGRSFMYPIDCPFRCATNEIRRLKNEGINIIFIDFHAEASAEKLALGWHLNGQVSAVIGSHTHVQTADERLLPQGTAYITDAGMTGSFDSIIGMDKDTAIRRFLTQMPVHYKSANGDPRFCGVIITIDRRTGHASKISRFEESE